MNAVEPLPLGPGHATKEGVLVERPSERRKPLDGLTKSLGLMSRVEIVLGEESRGHSYALGNSTPPEHQSAKEHADRSPDQPGGLHRDTVHRHTNGRRQVVADLGEGPLPHCDVTWQKPFNVRHDLVQAGECQWASSSGCPCSGG
jgi:hypothetical protein